MIRRFARPYAKAIFEVNATPEAANAVRAELQRFEQARASSTDLQELYANPGIEFSAKSGITQTLAKRLGLSDMAGKVLDILIRNHRINDLAAIVDGLAQMVRDATGTVAAEVRSAQPLSNQDIAELRRTLEKKFARRVEVSVTPDPSLLGGFVAKVGSEVYDASVAGKIRKFRESLT
ncbi:MAG TPA: ATP synthase F1 subunit delta [Thermoanaerobaculia bacterium]|nr:ATP synthase F1 subunit delta [Thermoanaerobaculia bacterium]